MTRAVAVGSALAIVAVSGACSQIAALDEFDDVAAGGAGSGGASTAAGGTPNPSCVATPPSGWLGPVAFRIAEDRVLLDCDPGWSVQTALGGIGPTGGDLTCTECTCGVPTGVSCPTTVSAGVYPNDGVCGMTSLMISPTTTCTSHSSVNAHFQGAAPTPIPGVCASSGGEVMNAPAAFGEHAVVCSPAAEAPSCDDGVSVPGFAQPNDWATCIYQVASLSNCPAGSAYGEGPYVVATQYEDHRACTECACDTPQGAACGDYLTAIYSQLGCSSLSGFLSHDGTCTSAQWTMRSYALMDVPDVLEPGSCEPKQPSVSAGAVDVEEELTVCCIGAS